MRPKKILIGSSNLGKIQEIKEVINEFLPELEVLSLYDFNFKEKPQENGQTFKENAILKAKFYYEKFKIPTIGDDGGLIIPALGNEPGVKSRRWPGYEATDEELIEFLLKKMENVSERTAYLETCVCFYDGKNIICQQEKIKGYIAREPSKNRIPGYPFRSVFIVEGLNKYYDELNQNEEIFSHRKIATQKLILKVKELFEMI